MTTEEWLYDCRHILKKLKDGADFVDAHAVLSLNQYREKIVTERQRLGMNMNPVLYQRIFIEMNATSFSDTDELEVTSQNLSAADLPQFVGDEDISIRVFSASGHKKAYKSSQQKMSLLVEYTPHDYTDYPHYYIDGRRLYYFPKTDQVSLSGIFSNPFEIYTTKALVVDGQTESLAGIKRLITIYDEYPFDLDGMVMAIKLFISEKFGVSMNLIEDYIADNEDQLKVIKSGQK